MSTPEIEKNNNHVRILLLLLNQITDMQIHKLLKFLQISAIPYGFTLFISFFINTTAQSQESLDLSLSAGITYSHAPSLSLGNRNDSGQLINIFGDLRINEQMIGRLEYSSLQTSSLSAELEGRIESCQSITGAGGYIFKLDKSSQFVLPVMFTGGYAWVKTNSFSVPEQGMQLGFTIAPEYRFNQRISALINLRILRGIAVNSGAKINTSSIGVGIALKLF